MTTTWRPVREIWPWSIRQRSDATVRVVMAASRPRVRAAWPETAVPTTS